MAIVLSLLSAIAYGVSDFLGGVFAKRSGPWQIATVGQTSAATCTLVAAAIIGGTVTTGDWVWGAVAGIGSGIGVAFLYRGLSTGRMSVVAPLSGVVSALLPVAVGFITGERPSALAFAGIVVAFPAIALVSRAADDGTEAVRTAQHRDGILDGFLAGAGFGFMYAALGQVGDESGLWPLALTQASSAVTVVVIAIVLHKVWVPRDRDAWRAVMMGPLGAIATGSFLLATREGLLTIVSVVSALYPAATVLLAVIVLRERIQSWQIVGLGLAAAAVMLVALA